MSSNLAYYKYFYDIEIFVDEDIHDVTAKGVLTKEEYKIITGKDYVA